MQKVLLVLLFLFSQTLAAQHSSLDSLVMSLFDQGEYLSKAFDEPGEKLSSRDFLASWELHHQLTNQGDSVRAGWIKKFEAQGISADDATEMASFASTQVDKVIEESSSDIAHKVAFRQETVIDSVLLKQISDIIREELRQRIRQ